MPAIDGFHFPIECRGSSVLYYEASKCSQPISYKIYPRNHFVPRNIMLYNKPLPWVDSHIHLGHLVRKDETMFHDLSFKRSMERGTIFRITKREDSNTVESIAFALLLSTLFDLHHQSACVFSCKYSSCISQSIQIVQMF